MCEHKPVSSLQTGAKRWWIGAALILCLAGVRPVAALRLDATNPSPVCLGESFAITGSFGSEPSDYVVQVRPASPTDNRILVRWRPAAVSWSSTRLQMRLGASAVPPGTYRLIVDTRSEYAALRGVDIQSCGGGSGPETPGAELTPGGIRGPEAPTAELTPAPIRGPAAGVASIRVQGARWLRVSSCAPDHVLAIDGGPFIPGTDTPVGVGHWVSGHTWVEVRTAEQGGGGGGRTLTLIGGGSATGTPPVHWTTPRLDPAGVAVQVESRTRIRWSVSGCLLRLRWLQIRVVMPNGERSDWMPLAP